jgi:NADPH2:quinone reductase
VQIARLMGARVIAAASSQSKLDVCLSQGAEAGIDYTSEDLKQRIRDLTDGRGADAVLDPVGGAYSEPALRATRWRGRFVTVGFASGEIPKIPLNIVLLKGVDIIGFDIGSFGRFGGKELTDNQAELWDLFDSGQLRPHISSVHPLESAAAALAEVAACHRESRHPNALIPAAQAGELAPALASGLRIF